ncbi:alpha/beta hydrolase [Nocardia alni]|uniref:alpha/beta hydrolase n=1 Tax=Nocardia alni TaxID=2815723 RepID=UPI0020B24B83|nr:alpha/beta hydrolase-fold protein [Nocardia alni]
MSFPPPPPPQLTSSGNSGQGHGIALLHGWLPITVEVVAIVALVAAVGWRTGRWRLVSVPAAAVVGLVVALWARWLTYDQGWAGTNDHAPVRLWWLVGTLAAGVVVLVLGWRSARWWRRLVSVVAIVLVGASAALTVNQWVGYYPTVQAAWADATAGALPQQGSLNSLAALRNTTVTGGRIVPITTPGNVSGMRHRTEYVYLPPAWFHGSTPRRLPVVMMIGGEFASPSNWIRVGGILPSLDAYAEAHGGWSPILVFPDTGGTFTNDTECVNGPRDDSATHLTAEVAPYVEKTFGAATDPANWGVAGFSMGGTCAIDLAVMHPELFGAFVDIAGDIGPNAGDKQQTITRLYGGNAAQWKAFDPRSTMAAHGPYRDTSGLFYTFTSSGTAHIWSGTAVPTAAHDKTRGLAAQSRAAAALYTEAHRVGIDCAMYSSLGAHTWNSAAIAFQNAMPWLFGRVGNQPVST